MSSVVTACRTIAHAHCHVPVQRHSDGLLKILLEFQATGVSTIYVDKTFVNARQNAKNNY